MLGCDAPELSVMPKKGASELRDSIIEWGASIQSGQKPVAVAVRHFWRVAKPLPLSVGWSRRVMSVMS